MSLFKDALLAAVGSTSAVVLSERTGISRSRLSEFLNGKSLPKDDSLKELCEAFSPNIQASLASAWIRERLGREIADMILASETLSGTPLEKVYTALPTPTQKAFYDLMTAARDDSDLRASLESLAAYSRPDAPTNIVKYTTPGGTAHFESAVADVVAKDPAHP